MRKCVKRILALTTAAVVASLAGCGASSTQGTDGQAAAGQTSQESQTTQQAQGGERPADGTAGKSADKTVIEYWHCNAETQGGLTVDELVKKV